MYPLPESIAHNYAYFNPPQSYYRQFLYTLSSSLPIKSWNYKVKPKRSTWTLTQQHGVWAFKGQLRQHALSGYNNNSTYWLFKILTRHRQDGNAGC